MAIVAANEAVAIHSARYFFLLWGPGLSANPLAISDRVAVYGITKNVILRYDAAAISLATHR